MGLLCSGFVFLLAIKSLGGITITQNDQVSQTQVITQRDKQVTLKCNHDDDTYYYMYWYRQRSQGELSLVAISVGRDNKETVSPFTEPKYIMQRPAIKESSLEIKNVVGEDSGIYFCASSITQYLNLAR